MISDLLMVSFCRSAAARPRAPSLQSGLLARTHTRARTHEFNVPNEVDARKPRPPRPRARPLGRAQASRPAHPGAPLRRARQGRVRAARRSPRARRSSNTRARSSPGSEAQRRHPHDPDDPNHTFYFHIDDKHVIDANVGGNAARWINHACEPNCEADEVDGRVFIKALRDIEPGEELFYDYGLIIDERYTPKLKKQFECRCGARKCRGTMLAPEALSDAMRMHRTVAALGRRGAVAAAEPLLPGLSVEVVRACRRPTRRCSSARAVAEPRPTRRRCAQRRARRFGRRAGDSQPCLLVAEHQTAGRGRQGRAWQVGAGASLTFSLALPLAPRRLVGPVARGRRGAGRRARPAAPARRAAPRPEVAERPVAGRRAGGGGRKLGGVLIETVAARRRGASR